MCGTYEEAKANIEAMPDDDIGKKRYFMEGILPLMEKHQQNKKVEEAKAAAEEWAKAAEEGKAGSDDKLLKE